MKKTVTVNGKRRKVLDEPLSHREIVRQHNKTDAVSGVVRVKLEDVFGDFEHFLDVLSERLVGDDLLMETSYDVVGFEPHDVLLILVSGDPSMSLDCMEGR